MVASSKDLQLRELKDMLQELKIQIRVLTETLAAANRREQELQAQQEELRRERDNLKEQVDLLTKKLFGASSEKSSHEFPGQLSLFNEAETEQSPEEPQDNEPETSENKRSRKEKATHEEMFRGIPVEKVLIPLADDQKHCHVCGTEMVRIGEEFVRRELKFIPAKLRVIEYYTETYGCPNCKDAKGDTETAVIVKSEAPMGLIGKSFATPSLVAQVLYQKYGNSVPFYRQEKDWKQAGAALTRTSMANWAIYSSEHYFQVLYDHLHRLLLTREFLMADETPVQVLKEPGRRPETKSYMWLFRSGEDGLPPIVLYRYYQTRAGQNASDFLKGFHGYLQTDGYQGYNKVPEVHRCTCWAHIRRYFIEAVPKGKQFDYNQPAVQGVHYCDRLFQLEREITTKCKNDFEKRKTMRLEKEKPVLEAFWRWLDELNPVRNSKLDKAVTYIQNRREFAMTYLEDGRCSFSNNLSENAIRPFTVGRKNWLFSDSVNGAQASAVIYTMVEMAKAHGLRVNDYLQFILEQRPDSSWTEEQLNELLPWSEMLQHLKQSNVN